MNCQDLNIKPMISSHKDKAIYNLFASATILIRNNSKLLQNTLLTDLLSSLSHGLAHPQATHIQIKKCLTFSGMLQHASSTSEVINKEHTVSVKTCE